MEWINPYICRAMFSVNAIQSFAAVAGEPCRSSVKVTIQLLVGQVPNEVAEGCDQPALGSGSFAASIDEYFPAQRTPENPLKMIGVHQRMY